MNTLSACPGPAAGAAAQRPASAADEAIVRAAGQIAIAARPRVEAFFDEPTFTFSYLVSDPATGRAAIVDPVLEFDQPSGRRSTAGADAILAHAERQGLKVEWILETHAHADHLTAAPYLREKTGAKVAIGREIVTVQKAFGEIFNEG